MSRHQTKQRAVEIAIKEAARPLYVTAYDEDGMDYQQEVDLDDRDIERIARAAIEAAERWEKQHAQKDA